VFLVPLKTLVIEATRGVFDADYPQADFRSLWVSMEFPADRANYPGIWVDFMSTAPLQTAGVDHHEYVVNEITGLSRRVGRWRYGGSVTFTVAALTSLERDRLVDELVRVLAFGGEHPQTAGFRSGIEQNDLIACDFQWDRFVLTQPDANPGTPWGTEEVLYEQTVQMDCQGEFVADTAATPALVPLSAVVAYSAPQGEPLPSGADGGGWL
jgi:hypothetical protein